MKMLKVIWQLICGLTWLVRQARLHPREMIEELGRYAVVDDVPMVWLTGSAYQRGWQQGHLLNAELQRFRSTAWEYAPHAAITRLGVPAWIAPSITKPALRLLATMFLPSLSVNVRAEMQGLADATQIPLADVLVQTVVWELLGSQQRGPLHCSEVAVSANRTNVGSLLGYNYDVIADDRVIVEGFLYLFVVQPSDGTAYVSVNSLGTVGLNTALNAHGVAFGWDNAQLASHVPAGRLEQPYMLVLRDLALHATSLHDAVTLLQAQERPQADISVVADRTDVAVVELAGQHVAVRRSDSVWSCNLLQHLAELDARTHSYAEHDGRQTRYAELVAALSRPIGVTDIARVLRDQDGATHLTQIANERTTFSVIYAPAQGRCWVSLHGTPASQQPLRAFDLQGRRWPADDVL